MTITLPYPPSANRYWRMARGHMHKSNEARAYQGNVGLLARAAGMKPITGDVSVSVWVYRPAKRGDLDNVACKVVLDALKGCAFNDDKQVAEIHAYRGDDKANPRVEVRIEPVPGVTGGKEGDK